MFILLIGADVQIKVQDRQGLTTLTFDRKIPKVSNDAKNELICTCLAILFLFIFLYTQAEINQTAILTKNSVNKTADLMQYADPNRSNVMISEQ